jgi:signal transduction histidine kinase
MPKDIHNSRFVQVIYGQALRRTDDTKLLDYLGRIRQSSERLLPILNDMIDISEIESARLTLNHSEFHLGEVIEYVKNIIAPKAAEKNLTLNFNDVADIDTWLLIGDRDRLGQILLNLVENAIKFTPIGSVIVRGHVTQDDTSFALIWLEVQDTGIGISAAAHARLFLPFEQADNSNTRQFGGTGLGLAICKRLVKMMDGAIGVESTEGLGSTFWFHVRLPLASPQIFLPSP